jgi:hypothetical protein
MNNQQKAEYYHSLLLRHDKLEGKIADIKSESAGMELNADQKAELQKLEEQKAEVVAEAQKLFF